MVTTSLQTMSTSKQSASLVRGQDWCVPKNTAYPTQESLMALWCPFEIGPSKVTNIPTEQLKNIVFGTIGQPLDASMEALWLGYYMYHNGTWHMVVNTFGIWFELRRQEGAFEAFQVACLGMELAHLPIYGINQKALALSGEDIPTPTQGLMPANDPVKEAHPQPLSQIMHRWLPPHGTEDNPFGLANLMNDPMDNKPIWLEGIPPDRYKGDQAKTHQFLTQFKQFMMINQWSAIAQDPLSKSAYFLSLIGGSKADGWAEQQYIWLDKVKCDPYVLPHRMSAWDALEQDFKTSFIDYAVYEKAHEQLRNLKMKEGNIDQFIMDFEFLAHRVWVDMDDPTVLHLFKMGIPIHLMDMCVDHGPLTNFEQWMKATQQQQRNWIIKQGVWAQHAVASLTVMQSQSRNNAGPCGQFF